MPIRHATSGALVAAGGWALWRSASYLFGTGAERRHVESAWFVLIGVVLVAAIMRRQAPEPSAQPLPSRGALVLTAALVVAALALYWPAFGLGLLSDDYVLSANASRGVLLDPTWEFKRPIPLALWALVMAIVPATLSATGLHVLNIVLHALNARLVVALARVMRADDRRALFTGVLFLATPLVEPIVWPAGIFDVLLLTFCLCCTLAMTVDERWTLPLMTLCAVGGVLTKESGVVIGVLPGLVLLVRKDLQTKTNIRAVVACFVVGAAYVLARVAMGLPDSHTQPMSGYELKELLVRPFATLALPVHDETIARHRIAALVWVGSLIALVVAHARRWHRRDQDYVTVVALCAWILVTVAPLSRTFFVSRDLEGARLLYLAYPAWALVLSILFLPRLQGRTAWPGLAGATVVAVVSLILVRQHLSPWIAAADTRDAVLEQYRSIKDACPAVAVEGLPDAVRGAYVFRNGFAQAAGVGPATADSGCVFVWRDGRFERVR